MSQKVNNSASRSQVQNVLDIENVRLNIENYNKMQTVLNEDIFGPLQNDSLVIVVQVSYIYVPICTEASVFEKSTVCKSCELRRLVKYPSTSSKSFFISIILYIPA